MSFNKSLEFSLQMEGLYCDEPGDAGGETYRGIARVYHPHWVGWELIDSYKQQLGLSSPVPKQFWKKLNSVLGADETLQEYMYGFYKESFWDALGCDYFVEAIAHLLLDFGINSGLSRGIKHLQKAIVGCGTNVTVDGKIGKQTINACNELDANCICEYMLQDREAFYRAIVANKPSQEKFLRGWINRVNLNREFIQTNYLG